MPKKIEDDNHPAGKAPGQPVPTHLAPAQEAARPVPTIPLTSAARSAYEELYAKNELAIQSTADPGVLGALNGAQTDVRNILTKDNMYRLKANTALYSALLEQIESTNDELAVLQKQIAAIAKDFEYAADILAAIEKVLKVVPIP